MSGVRHVFVPSSLNSTFGNLTLDGASGATAEAEIQWDLFANVDDSNGTAGTDYDQIVVGGNLTKGVDSDGITIQIELHGAADISDFFFDMTRTWTVVSTPSIRDSLFVLVPASRVV